MLSGELWEATGQWEGFIGPPEGESSGRAAGAIADGGIVALRLGQDSVLYHDCYQAGHHGAVRTKEFEPREVVTKLRGKWDGYESRATSYGLRAMSTGDSVRPLHGSRPSVE